jgi:serine/threonine protein kinase
MGEVYRARDTRLGREVAVKVLPHDVADNPERLARFEREARSASALNHPVIVTIHDFASAGGRAYLVMELVRGESLRDVLARGALPPRQLFPIAAAVADGLAAAHAAGIVHRDLKPENVMVTGDGAPKILDFGLVKGGPAPKDVAGSATELQVTEAGVVYGTASYMSPEQARGEPVDFRSDQFALGLILSEGARICSPGSYRRRDGASRPSSSSSPTERSASNSRRARPKRRPRTPSRRRRSARPPRRRGFGPLARSIR